MQPDVKILYIVIVTYNGIKWIDKCLNSCSGYNVLVIDNKSTDNTVEYIRENFKDVKIFTQTNNLGFGQANNIGLSYAYKNSADYVFLLNQDAYLEPDTITKLISVHSKEQEYGILSPIHLNGKGDALDYNFSTYILPSKCKNLYSDIFLNKIKKQTYQVQFVNAAAWLLSRRCIEIVGGFNPSFFHYGEDDNYIQRVKFHKLKVGVLPISKIFHDRETRGSTNYFEDEKKVFKRKLILKGSNPLYNYSYNKEYFKLYKEIVRSILFVKPKAINKAIFKLSILNSLDKKDIVKNKIKSMAKNTSFLKY